MELILTAVSLAAIALAVWFARRDVKFRAEAGEVQAAEREKLARYEAEVELLRERLAEKNGEVERAGAGRERFERMEKAFAGVKGLVEGVKADQDKREQTIADALSAFREQQRRATDGVEALIGRYANPKARGSLAEDWLVAGLERLGLRQGLHFDVQKATSIGDLDSGSRGLLDVYLTLPNREGVALDAKFPWSEAIAAIEEEHEADQEAAMADVAGRLRAHVRDLAKRDYTAANDVNVTSVWLVVPDANLLELARRADPEIDQFAQARQIVLLPVEALYAVAHSIAYIHQMDDWTSKVAAAFGRREAEDKIKALEALVEKVSTAIKRFNSAGNALDEIVKMFGANGSMTRHVIAPTVQLAGRAVPEVSESVKGPDEGRAEDYSQKVAIKRADLQAELTELSELPKAS